MSGSRAPLRLTRRLAAAPGEVWRALTDADSLARRLAPAAVPEAGPGGALELGTVLVLHHLRLEDRLGQAYADGWARQLDRLEEIVGGGGRA